jgi:hypothetical protein
MDESRFMMGREMNPSEAGHPASEEGYELFNCDDGAGGNLSWRALGKRCGLARAREKC